MQFRWMPRPYSIALVGTSHRQQAIDDASEGQAVNFLHEPGNPYDDRAIAVTGPSGAMLGYVPKDSWLKDALLDEEKGCRATIADIKPPAGVILRIHLDGPRIGTREFEAG